MAKSTKSKAADKPSKPRPDFPLFPHATGRWAKKVRQKLHYFGKIADDPDGQKALAKWLDQKDDLLAGRTPRAHRDGLTVGELVNQFLNSKNTLVQTGELSPRTFYQYRTTAERIAAVLGKPRFVDDLIPQDFEQLRLTFAEGRGPVALNNEITIARMVFKFAFDQQLIDKPIRFGQSLQKSSKKTLRVARAAKGQRMFEAGELRAILANAKQPLRAMILLAANTGFGQTDVANLPLSALDLDGAWVQFPRPKTGIERRCPLWPETVEALRDAIANRPKLKDKADGDLVFLTRFGVRWVKTRILADNKGATPDDAIGKEFTKLLGKLNLHRDGLGFYALRHGFETIGGEARDQVAVNAIMGHVDETMAGAYREKISDARLKAVVDHVRKWLFSTAAGDHQEAGQAPASDERPALRVVG